MAYDVEKLHRMENALRTTACLVGKPSASLNEDGFKVGLGLTNEADICQNAADAVKEGVFKAIVMGTFKNGKSTIINALIGSNVLPVAATPATAIISYIRYGGEDKKIFVYNTDGTVKEMTPDRFYDTYKFTKEDAAECKVTGKVSRFENVDYSVVYCDKQLLANGVQILDSPGLEDKACATKLTLQSASNANAIIYTGSVPSGGFNINDQEFFKSNFEGRHLNNVFFLINKSDFHDDVELQEVKDYFKEQLKDVFSDTKGNFDEALYNKRVFFISARNVLEYKTGEYSKKYDDRDLPEFQKFEKELEEFLTTDARSVATFNSCFAKIANAYKAAIHTAGLNKAAKEKGVEEVNNDIAKAEAKLAQMEVELGSLRKSFTVAQTKTQSIFEKQMNSIVDNINDTWDVEMSRIVENSGFSTGDLMQIAWQAVRYINNEERRNEAFAKKVEPITSGVQRFITKKVEEASSDIVLLTKPVVKQLSEDIKQTQLKLDGLFKDIYTLFNVDDANIKKGDVNIFKLLTSMSNTDPNLMIEVLAGNDIGWGDFLKRTLIEMFMDTLLFSLIGGPVGLALFVVKEWWALNKGRNHMASDLARKSKDGLISDLRKKIEERSELMYSKINKEYDLEFNRISKDVRAKISEERKLLEDMKNKLSNAQFDYASEIDRCEYITNKIWDIAHTSYVSVFERELTKETFELLSVH